MLKYFWCDRYTQLHVGLLKSQDSLLVLWLQGHAKASVHHFVKETQHLDLRHPFADLLRTF